MVQVPASIVERLFRTASVQRWTDHVRPIELTTLGKHSHEMVIAWVLGHEHRDAGLEVDWEYLIRGSLFELLRKSVLTDIKAQVFKEIRVKEETLNAVNEFAFSKLEPELRELGDDWVAAYVAYWAKGSHQDESDPGRYNAYQVLRASSVIATLWEWHLLEPANQTVYDLDETRSYISSLIEAHQYTPGFMNIVEGRSGTAAFVDTAGRLRCQLRWSQTPIVPTRTVLDHELLTAYLAYLATALLGARLKDDGLRNVYASRWAKYQSFFGGLFHDLPEVFTRDVISPVKSGGELQPIIQVLEHEWFEQRFRRMLPREWYYELQWLAFDEFGSKTWDLEMIPKSLRGVHAPDRNLTLYDGPLIKSCDLLCSFLEAAMSLRAGTYSDELFEAIMNTYRAHQALRQRDTLKIDWSHIYDSYLQHVQSLSVCPTRFPEQAD